MDGFKTLARTTVLERGKFLTVEDHRVELPDGRVIDDWSWVVTPDFVNMLAVTDEGRALCFRQPKYAIDGISLAIPGGYVEPSEDPLAAAQRELMEETGYEAALWKPLGAFPVDPNRGAGTGHAFLATGAHRTAEPIVDDLEPQELVLLTLDEVRRALLSGEFKALHWTATVALALAHLQEPQS